MPSPEPTSPLQRRQDLRAHHGPVIIVTTYHTITSKHTFVGHTHTVFLGHQVLPSRPYQTRQTLAANVTLAQ